VVREWSGLTTCLCAAVVVVDDQDGVAVQEVLRDQQRAAHVRRYAPAAIANDLRAMGDEVG
jgi:hypothetical protein